MNIYLSCNKRIRQLIISVVSWIAYIFVTSAYHCFLLELYNRPGWSWDWKFPTVQSHSIRQEKGPFHQNWVYPRQTFGSLSKVWYTLSNVILVDKKLTSFHQYLRYCHRCDTILFVIHSTILWTYSQTCLNDHLYIMDTWPLRPSWEQP